jgi:NAD-dependent DNA ligase
MDTSKFDSFDNKSHTLFCSPAQIERDFQSLVGIINGVSSDGVINEKEILSIANWIMETKQYENKHPYNELVHIVGKAVSDFFLDDEEKENIIWYCSQYIQKNGYYDVITGRIQQLGGILHGIAADGSINKREVEYLQFWLEDNAPLKSTYPFDEIYSVVYTIYEDKVLSEKEAELLLGYCNAFANVSQSARNDELIKVLNIGVCQKNPEVIVADNMFCMTGESGSYSRKEIAEKIELYGGIVTNSVTKKLNYLVVCDEKSSCWAFACYGRKIEQAINIRKSGGRLVILHEQDLFKVIESL